MIHSAVDDMCRHDPAEPGPDEPSKRRDIGDVDFLIGSLIDGHLEMRIGAHVAVTGKMLSHPGHACLPEALQQCTRQLGHDMGIGVQRAIPDHTAFAAIQVEQQPLPDFVEALFEYSLGQLRAEAKWVSETLAYMSHKPWLQ